MPVPKDIQLRAKAELEKRKRQEAKKPLEWYRYRPNQYIEEKLGWTPTSVQQDIIDAYVLALRQQHEKLAYQLGEKSVSDLAYWRPGDTIQNRFHIQAAYNTGKTKLAAGILSHFFDCFKPVIGYTFAPKYDQINDLLWKELRADRNGKSDLRGEVLDTPRLKYKPNHFLTGKSSHNRNRSGMERIQGQHEKYMIFVLDEAEGIEDFVWDSVDTMMSGGITILLMLANPRSRTSRFYRERSRSTVANFRISAFDHPNVIEGKPIVPAAIQRSYIEDAIEEHAIPVKEHDPDKHTFEVPWHSDGTIYEPDEVFLYSVLGIPPLSGGTRTVVPLGRYEAAVEREEGRGEVDLVQVGIDVSRYGGDYGTGYVCYNGDVWRFAQWFEDDTYAYLEDLQDAVFPYASKRRKLSLRIDGSGGMAAGLIDACSINDELLRWFAEVDIHEVQFGSAPRDDKKYYDKITEMYFEASESLKGVSVVDPPEELESDLTEREYEFRNKRGITVKKLEEKKSFRRRIGRSPDDGDGFVLATAPEFVFIKGTSWEDVRALGKVDGYRSRWA